MGGGGGRQRGRNRAIDLSVGIKGGSFAERGEKRGRFVGHIVENEVLMGGRCTRNEKHSKKSRDLFDKSHQEGIEILKDKVPAIDFLSEHPSGRTCLGKCGEEGSTLHHK